MAARRRLAEAARAMLAEYAAMGRQPPATLFQRCHIGCFGDAAEVQDRARQQVRSELRGQLRNRKGQFIARPSGRGGRGTSDPIKEAEDLWVRAGYPR